MNKRIFWISILIGVMLLLVFVLISNVISVGERLRNIHAYIEYAFYGLAVLLAYILIINPLRVIFMAPNFVIDVEGDDKKNAKAYRQASLNLIASGKLNEQEKDLLKNEMKNEEALPKALKTVYNGSIRKEVDKIIIKHSKTVMLTTAISQNGNFDMFSVIVTNIKMIKEIVKTCGFRPTYVNLGKLSVNVAVTAMIAEGLEDVNFNEMLPSKAGEAMSDLPILRTATNSIFQGISNSMLTCRIGIVTRRFLFQDNQLMSKRELRLQSYKESFKLMPLVIADGLVTFPKSVVNFVLKPFKRNPFKDAKENTG